MAIITFTRKRNIKGLHETTLFNRAIQLISIGLMLDKGFTWGKAYRAF
jgi:hypothetical protein